MLEALRTSYLGAAYYRILQTHLLIPIQKWGLTPNQLTLLGVVAAAFVPLGFMVHPIVGLLMLTISGVADSLDGLMARHQHQASQFGAFLDSSLDRLSDFFYLLGFWSLLWPSPRRLTATLLVFVALLSTLMISYVKARAESLGILCPSGMMSRAVRVIYLIGWALLVCLLPSSATSLLWIGLAIYIGLTIATLIRRIVSVKQQLLDSRMPSQ
jgi:CDP-diacylglycerol--glycerol-3-phosphate 3-phosphatidyltransferase